MFETWISDFLASSLGHFIDVKTDQLKVSLWKGVIIENVRIRHDAPEQLQLPLQLKSGLIKRFQIQVPWRALHLSPIIIHLSGVQILAAPLEDWQWSSSFPQGPGGVKSTESSLHPSLKWRIFSQIWNNLIRRLQLKIDDLEVIFEDQRGPNLPVYSFGVRCSGVRNLEQVDLELPRTPVPSVEILKIFSIEDLNLFWNCDQKLISRSVLESCSFKIFVYLQSQIDYRHFDIEVEFPEIQMTLHQHQLVSLVSFLEDWKTWLKRRKYGRHRPMNWRSFTENRILGMSLKSPIPAQELWFYAIQCVLDDLAEKQENSKRLQEDLMKTSEKDWIQRSFSSFFQQERKEQDQEFQDLYPDFEVDEFLEEEFGFSGGIRISCSSFKFILQPSFGPEIHLGLNRISLIAQLEEQEVNLKLVIQEMEEQDWMELKLQEETPVLVLEFDPQDPPIRIELTGFILHLNPVLISQIQSLESSFPVLTHQNFLNYSCSLLPSKISRILSFLEQPGFSQGLDLTIQDVQVWLGTKDDGLGVLVDSIKASSEGPGLNKEKLKSCLQENEDLVVFEDLVNRWIYSKWTIQVQEVSLVSSGSLLDPISANGDLFFSLCPLEQSFPAIITNWRLTPLTSTGLLTSYSEIMRFLSDFKTQMDAFEVSNALRFSSDGLELIQVDFKSHSEGLEVEFKEISPISIFQDLVRSRIEFSVSCPGFLINLESTLNANSDTVNLTGSIGKGLTSMACTMQKLRYKAHEKDPVLAQLINTEELNLCLSQSELNGVEIHGKLSGVDVQGLTGDLTGFVGTQCFPNSFSLDLKTHLNQQKLKIGINGLSIGSQFLTRLLSLIFGLSSTIGGGEVQSTTGGGEPQSTTLTALEVDISRSLLALPGPLDTTGVVLNLTELQLRLQVLDLVGFSPYIELERLHCLDGSLLVKQYHEESCFLPVLQLPKISVESNASKPLTTGLEMLNMHRRVDYQALVESISIYCDEVLFQNLLSSLYGLIPRSNETTGPVLDTQWKLSSVLKINGVRFVLSRSLSDFNASSFQYRIQDLVLQYEDYHFTYNSGNLVCFWMPNGAVLDRFYFLESKQLTRNCQMDLMEVLEQEQDDNSSVSSRTSWETAGSRVSSSLPPSNLVDSHQEVRPRFSEDQSITTGLILSKIKFAESNEIQIRNTSIQVELLGMELDVFLSNYWIEMIDVLTRMNRIFDQFNRVLENESGVSPEVEIRVHEVTVNISTLNEPEMETTKTGFLFVAKSLFFKILSSRSVTRISKLNGFLVSDRLQVEGSHHLDELIFLRESRLNADFKNQGIALNLDLGDVQLTPSVQKLKMVVNLLELRNQDSPSNGFPSDLLLSNAIHFMVSIDNFLFSVLDDSDEFVFPLGKIGVQDCMLELESLTGSSVFPWTLTTSTELRIFNRQCSDFEEFLELLKIQMKGKMVLNSTSSPVFESWIRFMELEVQFLNSMELTLTPGMIRVFSIIIELLNCPKDDFPQLQDPKLADFWLVNKTGSLLEFNTSPGDQQDYQKLAINELRAIRRPIVKNSIPQKKQITFLQDNLDLVTLQETESSLEQDQNQIQNILFFQLSSQNSISGQCRLDQPEILSFPLEGDNRIPVLVSEVSIRSKGGFTVELRSNHQLLNDTALPMEIACCLREDSASQISPLESKQDLWIPVMAVSGGWIQIRPLRGEFQWSQKIRIFQFPQKDLFLHLECPSSIQGVNPVHLSLQIGQNENNRITKLQIKAPIKFQNQLPVPVDLTAILDDFKDSVLTNQRLDPQSSLEAYSPLGAGISILKIHPFGYRATQIPILFSAGPNFETIGGSPDWFQPHDDLQKEDLEILLTQQEHQIPISLQHQIEGCNGQESFIFTCSLWIYNLTHHSIAIREVPFELRPLLLEDSLFKEEEDRIPLHWIPPLMMDPSLEQPPLISQQTSQSIGLALIQQKGPAESFRLRSGGFPVKIEDPEGVQQGIYPSMELGGGPKKTRWHLQLRCSFLQAPLGTQYWSEAFSICSPHDAVVTEVTSPLQETSTRPSCPHAGFLLSLTTNLVPQSTGIVQLKISGRFLVLNLTPWRLQYRQQGTLIDWELDLGAKRSIHWTDLRRPRFLCFKIQEAGWQWSGGLDLESADGDMFLKLRHRVTEETLLIHVETSLSPDGVLLSTISQQDSGFAPYRLDNFTSEKIHVRQEGEALQEDVLKPYTSMCYAWDEPSGKQRVILEAPGRKQIGIFDLNLQIGRVWKKRLNSDNRRLLKTQNLRIELINEGPVRVLAILDEVVHPMNARPQQSLLKSTLLTTRSLFEASTSIRGSSCIFRIPQIGLSVISEEQELAYLSVRGLQLEARFQAHLAKLELSFNQFQVDTGRRFGVYPILLSCPSSPQSWTSGQKALTMDLSFWTKPANGVLCIESFQLELAGVVLEVEEGHFKTLMNYGSMLISVLNQSSETGSKTEEKGKVFIEDLKISQIRLNFSFAPQILSHSFSDHTHNTQMSFFQRVTILANVNGAQLRLKSCSLNHQLLGWSVLSGVLGRHYFKSLLHEVYKVLGSADLLGDPMGLLHHLGLGVWLLFANPAYTFVQSNDRLPRRLIMGFHSGIVSLISNVVFGISNAIAKFSSTARNGLIVVGLHTPGDPKQSEYVDLVHVVLMSWMGVLKEPMEGLDRDGMMGFVRGVAKGGLGVVSKPLNFVLEMFSNLAKGISQSLSIYSQSSLVRVPRWVLPGQTVASYDPFVAIGGAILQELENGVFQSEILEACFSSKLEDQYLVLTRNYLLLVEFPSPIVLRNRPVLEMVIPLEDIEVIKWNGLKVSIFGFLPMSVKRAKFKIRRPVAYPYFLEVVECIDISTSFKLSILMKKNVQIPRLTVNP